MSSYSASEARANLYRLIDETAKNHKPVLITGKRNNAVLVSEEDWSAIQETLHLLSVPGMRKSIQDGLASDLSDCSEEPGW
ncbi:type II toxin-antitoxin system Phd/YefM family antitoxin [Endozoicomonas sp. SCSIO W0465]|uniref:type II toxin-antitoxin system Phd/YefM family antitoxin n=1 Tax=Endozoicomonas sp. SCSIO W0465 TaxID=2918516 RepID=UPI0020753950|nr:type II toxin-antitoxin system Phd/YefM family antitoxin [Endozoicomonas sp. SCSIO W0465]USE35719.1 type II toxin-antitoxin system Phd/YefM family antitoxin [Endozoicomonas sp. SCSIO W0465]